MRLAVCLPVALLVASEPIFADKGSSYTFQLDNDLFANTDKDYTNGARLSYITGDRQESEFTKMESWLAYLHRQTPDIVTGFYAPESPVYNYGISLTQLMFTPDDFTAKEAPPGQHPYVGWLGLGFSLHSKDSNAINSIELSLGLTGRNAFAETTQDFVHSLRGIPKFNGWDSQMPSEPTLNVFFTQKRRLYKDTPSDAFFAIDGFSGWGLAVGNVKTAIDFGFINRVGFNLPVDVSDPRLDLTSYSHNIFDLPRLKPSDWSAFLVFGAKAVARLHVIRLDGPLFRHFEMGIEKEPFLGETYLGAAVRWRRWELSYAHTFRSREFEEQPKGPEFGSLSLRIQF